MKHLAKIQIGETYVEMLLESMDDWRLLREFVDAVVNRISSDGVKKTE